MKLPLWVDHWTAVCAAHGVPGDSRAGKMKHQFRILGKRVITFEFRPYRWVIYRFEREAFLTEVDMAGITKEPSPHEPGPTPCGIFAGTMPADDEALKVLMDRLAGAVAAGRLPFVRAAVATDPAEAVEPLGEAPEPPEMAD
ncbi:MAG: hypothetical protein H7338_08495 [Candidatus Sericytochromatia bacterium]|nr:hypothetical protein [Candidatus Sericytochromatia bacterium]